MKSDCLTVSCIRCLICGKRQAAMIPRAYQKEKEEWIMSETENQDLLAMTHLGVEPAKYMKSVTPPIFMNSLHVFDTVDEYFSVDIFQDEYYYGRASNPTVAILEKKLAALEHGVRAVAFSADRKSVV